MSTLAAKSWRAKIVSTGAVVIASVLASAHAVHAHRAHREAMTHVTHWQTVAEAAISASPGEGPRRVMINGAEVLVEKHTTLEGLEQVFAAAHAQCQSGDEGVALGLGASSDGVAHPIRLARITTTVADPSREDRASLCIFEKEAADPPLAIGGAVAGDRVGPTGVGARQDAPARAQVDHGDVHVVLEARWHGRPEHRLRRGRRCEA